MLLAFLKAIGKALVIQLVRAQLSKLCAGRRDRSFLNKDFKPFDKDIFRGKAVLFNLSARGAKRAIR